MYNNKCVHLSHFNKKLFKQGLKKVPSPHTVTMVFVCSGLCGLKPMSSLWQNFLGGCRGLTDLALPLSFLVPVQDLVDAVLGFLSGIGQTEIHVGDGCVVLHTFLDLFTTLLK